MNVNETIDRIASGALSLKLVVSHSVNGSFLSLSLCEAGVFCAIVSHPADSVVSVLNKEKGSTAVQVLKKLGPKGVWKGLVARIIMIGTLTALQWFIYDSVKVYFRLPRPPPPEMPESLKKKLGLTE
ncbi:phosphate carrier protein, mitochondrial-like [Cynoglossus semilaevis]|uniref:phosphate carrier protein, mitochondrial-like n=1 Tax=Cynoglossus semilaevis TaxID=244447 RepID=UPI0004960011|nr:phosphate carrier protein, mitochondrial-like [Cynoglossus semilaevis]